jgi:CheY-like chemotaxis protein
MKILIVDDDAAILRMMERLLSRRGHQVETCLGPLGASVRALRAAPDLVLLDVMMPALSGGALSEVISRLPLDRTPRIVLWSADDDALAQVAREHGLPTLSKRTDPIEVVRALEALAG